MLNDQAARLRRQVENNKNPRQAKTLCIISGKGGVGKSNIAVNFSLELINNGKKVLLIDLDVGMGNIEILLGLHAKKTIFDMFHENLLIHDIIEVGPNNLAYIAGGSGLQDFFSMDDNKKNFFMNQYNELINMFDYIIFDMGAGIQADSLFFILSADECIVVTTPEPTSITDAYSAIKHVINNKRNMPISVIMNRSISPKSGKQALDRFSGVIEQFLQINIRQLGILPDDKTVVQSVIKQVPYLLLNERSNVSKGLKELTFNYLSNGGEMNKTGSTSSFVKRLKQYLMER